jgi:hypothetical protein
LPKEKNFPSIFAIEKLQNHFIFEIFNFAFWGNFASYFLQKAVEEFVQESTSPYLPRQCFPITTGLHPHGGTSFRLLFSMSFVSTFLMS